MIISICINELYKEINQVVLEILPKYRMETTLGKQMYCKTCYMRENCALIANILNTQFVQE